MTSWEDIARWEPVAVSAALSLGLVAAVLLLRWVLAQTKFHFLARVAHAFRWLDKLLVERLSKLFGAHSTGAAQRWGSLGAIQTALCVVGALAPLQLAFAALIASLIGIIAYYRRWAWDEEDRARDLLPLERRIPIGEDLTQELTVCLAYLIFASSILIFRLEHSAAYFSAAHVDATSPLRFVLLEVLQALPFVGNVEVLDLPLGSGLEARQPWGGYATFLLRLIFDFLIIGGIVNLFSIARRAATGDDISRILDDLAAEPVAAMTALIDRAEEGVSKAETLLERLALAPAEETNLTLAVRAQAAAAIANLGRRYIEGGISRLQFASTALNNLASEAKTDDPALWAELMNMRAEVQSNLASRLSGQAASDARQIELGILAELADREAAAGKLSGIGANGQSGQGTGVNRATSNNVPFATLQFRTTHFHHGTSASPAAKAKEGDALIADLERQLAAPDLADSVRATLHFNRGGLLLKRGNSMAGPEAASTIGEAVKAFGEAEKLSASAKNTESHFEAIVAGGSAMTYLARYLDPRDAVAVLTDVRERLTGVAAAANISHPSIATRALNARGKAEITLQEYGADKDTLRRIDDLRKALETVTAKSDFGEFLSLQIALGASFGELVERETILEKARGYAEAGVAAFQTAFDALPTKGEDVARAVLLNNLAHSRWVLAERLITTNEKSSMLLLAIENARASIARHEANNAPDMAMGAKVNLSAALLVVGRIAEYPERVTALDEAITTAHEIGTYYAKKGEASAWLKAETNLLLAKLAYAFATNDRHAVGIVKVHADEMLAAMPRGLFAHQFQLIEGCRDEAQQYLDETAGP